MVFVCYLKRKGDIDMNRVNSLSSLDKIRLNRSTDDFKGIFHGLGEKQKQRAINYLNEDGLRFSSLFILIPEIKALDLYKKLNRRNAAALKICAQILKDETMLSHVADLTSENSSMTHSTLRWMIRTGSADDGLNDDYDEVMDAVASLLIKTHKDNSVLPVVADMIFKRNRKGYLVHDLVWCFFQAKTTDSLKLVAGYLRSPNRQDVELARQLLHFIPDETGEGANLQKQYQNFVAWLQENNQFLYFTGENLQFTSDPKPCRVDLDAKYLYKRISPYDHKPIQPLTEVEQNHLQKFHKLRREDEKLLSKYSRRIHDQNLRLWNEWMQYPLDKQIEIAKAAPGGTR